MLLKILLNIPQQLLRMNAILVMSILLVACNGGGGENPVDDFLGESIGSTKKSLAYSATTFKESINDGGVVDDIITITAEKVEFLGSSGEDFVASGKAVVSNVPAGLTATIVKNGQTSLSFRLTGAALSNTASDNVSNISVVFNDAAFNGGESGSITGAQQSGISLEFNVLQLIYSGNKFSERLENNGAINETLTVTLQGDTFNGPIGSDLASAGKVTSTNTPVGLTLSVIKTGNNTATISLNGNASSHTDLQDLSNYNISFQNTAFNVNAASNIDFSSRTDLIVDFINPAQLTYDTKTLSEATANNGTIGNTITITLANDVFTGNNGDNLVSDGKVVVANTPVGFTPVITRNSDTEAILSLTGTASSHLDSDDIANLTVTFNASAFTFGNNISLVENFNTSDIAIDFNDPVSLSYSTATLSESISNVGGISNTITITLANDTYNASIGENLIATSKASVTNLPGGMVGVLTVTATNTVVFSLLGNATNHANANDISNLNISFAGTAFTNSSDPAQIINSNRADLVVDFIDPYVLGYSASTFTEASTNNGTIGNSFTLTLTGTNFNGSVGENLVGTGKATVANVPGGLTAAITLTSATQATMTLSGTAASHANANDISNLTVTFTDSAFISNESDGVSGTVKNDIAVDFNDPASLAYSATTFTEADSNIGNIGTTLVLTLTNDTFTGSNGDNFVTASKVTVANVPAGLTAVATRDSDTQLSITLSGTAAAHANANSVSNLSVTFQNTAFSNVLANTVINYQQTGINLNYLDPYTLNYSTAALDEDGANDGSISETITLNLLGTTFTGSNGDDFVAGGKVSVANLPAGLTVTATKQSNTQIQIAFSGNATNHAQANDISNLTFNFQDNAFTSGAAAGVTNSSKNDISISFDDPPSLAYLSNNFTESVSNIGATSTSLNLVLTNKTWNASNGDDLVADSKATVTNVPTGLTAVITVTSPTLATMTLSGNATSHVNADDVSNITVSFLDAAYTGGNSAGVVNNTYSTISLDFIDPYTLSYNTATLVEGSTNNGTITTTLSLTLIGTTFTGSNGDDFVAGGKLTVNNLPAGLTAVTNRTGPSSMTVSFTGTATSNENADDVSNLELSFGDTAFASNAAAGVTDAVKSDFYVDFRDTAVLSYSGTTLNENVGNTGGISETLSITLAGDTFSGSNGDNFIANGKVTATNIPGGLTAVLTKTNDTTLTLSFTGSASSHANGNDISNFTLTFQATAFDFNSVAANVTNYLTNNISIDFRDPYSIAYSAGTFTEASANNGSIGNSINLDLTGTTYTGTNGDNFITDSKATVANVPVGLTAAITKISDTRLQVTLSGTATNHANINDIANLTINLLGTAFTSGDAAGVQTSSRTDINVDFNDPPSLAYSGTTFNEMNTNVGRIDNTITVTLSNDTFTGSNGEDFVGSSKISVTNLPAGLTAQAQRTSDTTIDITLISVASDHTAADNISNLTFAFQDSAFTNVAASNITGATNSGISISYLNPYNGSYSASSLAESVGNDGSISGSITVTLTGTTFAGTNSENFIATGKVSVVNVPTGLTASLVRNSDTQLTLAYTGNASGHANSDDVSNITLTYNDSAFSVGESDGVLNINKTDLALDFKDPDSLSYSASNFNEAAANNGSTSDSITITVNGDTFTGTNGENFVTGSKVSFSNVPTGLTPVVTRQSDTTVDVTFTGAATSNDDADDVSNLTITFADSAFTNNTNATNVTDYTKNNLTIDFDDPANINYGTASFSEAAANDGSISNTISITLSGDTLTGTNGENFVGSSKVSVTNVPTGLTPVVTRNSDTTLTFSLTGNASVHSSGDNVSNITLTFANTAFTNNSTASNVVNYTKSDFSINFDAPAALSYGATNFVESLANDGSISTTINVDLFSDTLTGSNGEDFVGSSKISVTNLPTGLTAVATKASDTQLNISLTGNASTHANAQDISNLTFTFQDSAFVANSSASNVTNYDKNDLTIDFSDPATLSYSGSNFNEAASNDGTVSSTINIDISGDTFSGSNGDNFVTGSKVALSNVPAGLTGVVTKTSSTRLTVSFTGSASSHAVANNVTNLGITFAASAFTNNTTASNVNNYTRSDLTVTFSDPANLSYSGNSLNEGLSNDGTISNSITITLAGDTFAGSNGDDFVGTGRISVANVPSGLTLVATRSSSTQLSLTATGNATDHAQIDDITNLTITFQNSAFTNNAVAANVVSYTRSDLEVNYNDPAILSYASSSFSEASSNNGSITDTITVNLSGDTLTGNNGDNFVAASKVSITNVPAGLTAVATRATDSSLTISLTGNATSNTSSDSISNLTVTFNDSAFTNNSSANNVTNNTKSNLSINFIDPPTLSYGTTTFAERLANDGGIDTTSTVSITSDNFSGSNGDNFVADGKIVVTNLPAGLTAVATRTDASTLSISITGTATVHANANDVSNLTFTFQDGAFANTTTASNVTGYAKSDLIIDFNDPASLIFGGTSLAEAAANDGSFTQTFTIDLAGDTFTGTNGDNFVTGSKVTVNNLPAGLTPVINRTSSTQLTFSLTGNATAHADANDVSNLEFVFQDSAFTNNASATNVTNYQKSDLTLNFADPALLSYSGSNFAEAASNTGSFSSTITITLSGDTFTGTNGDNFVSDSKATVTNLPAGLTASLVKASTNTLTLSLSGNASSHASANNISNLTVTFANSAFTNNTAASNVTNFAKNDISLTFNDPATLAYSSSILSESLNNDGSISSSITLTLSGDTFTGTNGEDYIGNGKVTTANVPGGLTLVLTKTDDTTLTLTATGNASSHANANDISNLTLTFQNNAFTNNSFASNVTNYNKSDLGVDFNDPATIAYSGSTFNEATANDGSVTGSITLTVSGDTFSGTNGENFISGSKVSVGNVPAGLTAVITRASDTTLTFTLTGNASSHANAQDISNLTVTLAASAFTNNTVATNVTNYTKTDISVNFDDPATLSYSGATFSEELSNTGSFSDTITITLAGDTFSGSNGDNFISDSKATVTNLPAGLTAVLNRDSSTGVTLSLTGNATSHVNADDIANLTITFADSAFTNNSTASNVVNYVKNDINLNFNDPATLAYSGSVFTEADANDGSSNTTLTVTLSGDTFTGSNSDNFVAASKVSAVNLPAGYTLVATKISDTTVDLTVTGNATTHDNGQDISNVQIIFADSAFTNNTAAANVTNYNKNDIGFNFNDPASLSYSGATFAEALANDGSITATIDITLLGDTFSGSNSDNFISDSKIIATNIPAGLTAVATKISSTVVRLSFTGNATSNANADDVSNLTFAFQNSAFTNNSLAANVTNFNRSDIGVDFSDPASLAYSASSLSEALANDGSFTDTFNIDIIGDTFSGTNSDNFVADSKISVTNLPAGLTLAATRVTNTRLQVSISGNASSHANSDDVSNLTLTFANSAFTNNATASNVTNFNRSDILLDFNDPASLIYASSGVNEAAANNGSITETIEIDIAGDTFTGTNGENYAGSKATISNVPTGLTAVLTKTSDTKVTLSFTGNASTHVDASDIANLGIDFAATAFTNNSTASNVINYNRSDLTINFNNPATLSYSGSTFNEDSGNNGGFSGQSITIDLSGDTFTGTNGDNFVTASKITVSNLPAGLTVVATRASTTSINVTITGTATTHSNAEDISNLTFQFENSAFTSTSLASDVSNSLKNDLALNFDDPASLSYATSTFNEALANDGSISNTITVTLTSDTFTGTNGDNFVSGGKLSVGNVPAGLTAVATRASDTTITLSLTGTATANADANDISNLTYTFLNGAFTNNATAANVTNYLKNDVGVNFENPASIAYSGASFTEAISNNGAISNTITLTLSGDTFTGTNGENYVSSTKLVPTNVPTGLTVSAVKASDTTLNVTLTGNASAHANADDISDLTFTLTNSAFTNNTSAANVINYTRSDLSIDYIDPATLAYSASTFTEAVTNDGNISSTITITLAGDTFTGTNGEDYVGSGKVTVANIPAGLTAVATKATDTTITLSLSGSATLHSSAQDVANLQFTFQNAAFTNNILASNVTNYDRSDVAVDFADPASIGYSSTAFAEAATNNGSLSGSSITLTLAGDTFSGTNGDNFVTDSKVAVTNLPAGLTAVITRSSPTELAFTITGTATVHADANDVSDLTVTFANSAFTNNAAAANVTNFAKSDLVINYQDPASLNYASTNFNEAATNNGSLAGASVVVTLVGDTFTGSNGENYIGSSKVAATNVPAGLTAVATKDSDTQITFTFTGSATNHANANDVADVTFTFADSAFTNNVAAANVTNYAKNDLSINFTDPASLSYASAVFNESASNNGEFSGESVVVTLAGDTFSGTNGEDFIGTSKIVATNVPTGLTVVANRDSDTQITFTLTGNATTHADANDIANLTFTFQTSAFANNADAANVTNNAKNDISVNFNDPAVLGYSGSTFEEALVNNGSISTTITITLTGDTFTGGNGSNYIADSKIIPSNVPAGLTAVVTKTSSTELSFTLSGTATSNINSDSISNLSLTFAQSAFTGNTVATNVTNFQKSDFAINFNDPYALSISTDTFTESTDDDGTMLNSVSMTLTGTTFTGSNGENYVSTSKVTVSNVPAGLTATVIKDNDNQLTFSLTGTATLPNPSEDISNLTFTFANSAFAVNDATLVSGYTRNDLNVNYIAKPVAAPTDLTITNSTATSVTITWTDVPTNNTYYEIESCTGISCGTTFVAATNDSAVSGTATTYTFNSLTEGAYYRFRIRAGNPAITSAWVTSGLTVPFGGITSTDNGTGTSQEFRDMACEGVEGTYIVLYWSSVTGASNYSVFDETSGSTLLSTVTDNKILITGLDLSTAYKFRVVVNMPDGTKSANSTTTDISSSADFVPCLALGGGGNDAATGLYDLYNPRDIHIYGTKLFLVDESNDRVLIWNTIPTTADTAPDVIVGQDFSKDSAGTNIGIQNYDTNDGTPGGDPTETNAKALNGPRSVWAGSVGGTDKMVIADRNNYRVLIWNSIPTTSHQAADVVVGQTGMTTRSRDNPNVEFGLDLPSGVWSDGTRLFIADSSNHRVNVYNTFPTSNGAGPDICLGQSNCSNSGSARTANRFNNPIYVIEEGGKLLVSDYNNNRVMVWNSLPAAGTTNADVVIGQTNFTNGGNGTGANKLRNPWGLHYDSTNSQLYVADYSNHRVKVFSGIPTANDASSTHVLGNSNTGNGNGVQDTRSRNPSSVAVTGTNVFVADTGNHRIRAFTSIPSADNTAHNFALGYQKTFDAAVYNFGGAIDGLNMTPRGISYDPTNNQLFVSDQRNDRVLVWNGLPTSRTDAPDFVLGQADLTATVAGGRSATRMNTPWGSCIGGGQLWLADYNNRRFMVWDLPITSNNQAADYILGQTSFTAATGETGKDRFRNPTSCFYDATNDRFFITDIRRDKVLMWDGLPSMTSVADNPAADYVIGTESSTGLNNTDVQDPYGVTSDGTYVYVADRGRRRVMAFPIPTADNPTASFVLGQPNFTTADNSQSQRITRRIDSLLYEDGHLYHTDVESNRVAWWASPGTTATDYQELEGQYGKGGTDWNTATRFYYSGLDMPATALATDGKRLIIGDFYNSRLLIVPLKKD